MNRISIALSVSVSVFLLASAAQAAPLDAALLHGAVTQAARANLPDTVSKIEVYSVLLRATPDIPEGADVSVRVRADGADDWIGHTNLDVMLTVNGAPLDPLRGSAEIIALVQVPVLREPLHRGERVSGGHLGSVLREADQLPGGLLRHAEDIVGRVARRDLGLNQLVRSADLTAVVHAQRNRPVTMLVGSGSLRVTASGVLREDASIGELVAVWVPSTNSVRHGILLTPDTVEVPFGESMETP